MNEPARRPPHGLCDSCSEAERTGNKRGSRFILCSLSRTDPRFERYPRMPVLNCDGYRPAAAPKADGAAD